MSDALPTPILDKIHDAKDVRALPKEQLPALAQDLRAAILNTVSQLGGHLGSSLGAAELTVALHRAFDTPHDRLVWDTGHQAYCHKLLTGRKKEFPTIRQFGGLSGFLKRFESPYDTFGAGHASTAISAALGMASARDLKKENRKVVAIVSDGCLTGGMSFEGMINAGHKGTDLLVILNDNAIFISNRVGALGAFLSKILATDFVRKLEQRLERFLKSIDFWGKGLLRVAKRLKVIFFPGILFEEMGFAYFGPVDGHDVVRLADVLEKLKNLKGPILLHVVTVKGKGYAPAEKEQIKYHGLTPFDVTTGTVTPPPPAPPAYTKVFGNALVKLAKADPRIVAITAAMPEGTGLDAFRKEIPNRFFDVGLGEQHAVTFAAGLAASGMKPVAAIYSTFLQRAFDQLILDVGYQKLPVVLALDRAGLVGEDGPTHHGTFDLTYLRMIPNFTVMAPSDENELQHMLATALQCDGPVAIRYPRGSGFGLPLDSEFKILPIGRGEVLKEGDDLTILAIGARVRPAFEAAQVLEREGLSCGVVNMRFAKPIDPEFLHDVARRSKRIVTVEENVLAGGYGSAVMDMLASEPIRVHRIGLGDFYADHGAQKLLYEHHGLSANQIALKIRELAKTWKKETVPA